PGDLAAEPLGLAQTVAGIEADREVDCQNAHAREQHDLEILLRRLLEQECEVLPDEDGDRDREIDGQEIGEGEQPSHPAGSERGGRTGGPGRSVKHGACPPVRWRGATRLSPAAGPPPARSLCPFSELPPEHRAPCHTIPARRGQTYRRGALDHRLPRV